MSEIKLTLSDVDQISLILAIKQELGNIKNLRIIGEKITEGNTDFAEGSYIDDLVRLHTRLTRAQNGHKQFDKQPRYIGTYGK